MRSAEERGRFQQDQGIDFDLEKALEVSRQELLERVGAVKPSGPPRPVPTAPSPKSAEDEDDELERALRESKLALELSQADLQKVAQFEAEDNALAALGLTRGKFPFPSSLFFCSEDLCFKTVHERLLEILLPYFSLVSRFRIRRGS